MKKLSKDAKIAISLIGAFLVVLAMYAVSSFYNNTTGEIEIEFILNYTEKATLDVNGFAVRDENKASGGKNALVLYKDENLFYVPVISDGENVSKNGVIALAFASQAEADAYSEEVILRQKLSSIKELEQSDDLSYSNILYLNSQTGADVSSYIDAVSRSDMVAAQNCIDTIAKNITSKQIAIGEDLDYKSIISDYNKKIEEKKNLYKIVKKISSAYAGYFVSNVDGFEEAFSYKDAAGKNVLPGEGERLKNIATGEISSAYGKIITQHTWFYIFDVDVSNSSYFKTGYWVKASFKSLGINSLNMQVYDISDQKDGKVTVTLRCTAMNEEISKIRKDTASVVLEEYRGFKISNEALTRNENGIDGVYAIVGNIMMFSPVEVLYYGDGYVIATGLKVLRDENDDNSGYYHMLKQYDKIIVKGMNLEDGAIVE